MTQARNLSRLLNKKLETFKFTATAGQTTFSDSDDAGNILSYTPENMLVTYNGVVLESGSEYTATNGTSVVLDTGADSAAEVNVYAFESVSLGGYVPSTGGTFGGPIVVPSGATGNQVAQVQEVVKKTGDTMTGPLVLNTSAASSTTDALVVQNSGVGSVGHTTGLRFRYITAEPAAIRAVLTDNASGAGRLGLFTSSDGAGGSLVERLGVDAAGRVTTPSQPAFFARPPANFAIVPETIITGTWSVDVNIGNHFNSSNGSFTVPVSGMYNIIWNCFITDDNTRRDTFIVVNGVQRARTEISGYSSNTLNISSMVAANLYLAANDVVTFGAFTDSGNVYGTSAPWSYASVVFLG